MSYILNIYTNPATDYIIDPEPVANLVANKSLFQMLPCFLLRSVCRAQPCHRCLGSRFSKKQKVSDFSETWFWAENESLSICSPLCISSNYLCLVLYSQFEGHLGCFIVSFSSPIFAIQTSELQLLTTNLRIIFELTKSKRDGLYL